jgi:hypothetical protein
MRIKLSTRITSGNINLCEIPNARNLDIIRRLDEMDSPQRSIRDRPGTTSTLRTPSHTHSLRITDRPNRRWSPETEIVNIIDPCCLAIGSLGRSGTAVVRPELPVLSLVWECVCTESWMPDLVRVAATAGPYLDLKCCQEWLQEYECGARTLLPSARLPSVKSKHCPEHVSLFAMLNSGSNPPCSC